MTDTQTTGTTIDTADLPSTIVSYLTAHRSDDADAALRCFTEDASVTDEGKTHRGHREIHDWLRHSASEYTFTIELTGARRIDAQHWVAIHHLEGNFPGGVVDLQFTFTLDGDAIRDLVIEP